MKFIPLIAVLDNKKYDLARKLILDGRVLELNTWVSLILKKVGVQIQFP